MRFLDLILQKKAGEALTQAQIEQFVQLYTQGEIPDYQVASLLMAICFQGMNAQETAWLTAAMAASGERVDLSSLPGIKVDKHSTGGVGDKVTLIIGPAAAALGVTVAKMSGRGLGHTGGTIDKLEAIPGFNTSLSEAAFLQQIAQIGIAIAGQTANLAPADKKLYALRDVTGTVQQMSLIASSVMSKKLASGADKIVLDVTCGNGAFMKTLPEARALAKAMVEIGYHAGLETRALLTNMNEPLGYAIGNSLEVKEAVECLQGRAPHDLLEVSSSLLAEMLILAGKAGESEAKAMAQEAILGGSGLAKFIELVKAQGGDPAVILDTSKLGQAPLIVDFKASKAGYIAGMNCEGVGICAGMLGAGRSRKEDEIDPLAGIVFRKKVGEFVQKGETICELHCSQQSLLAPVEQKLLADICLAGQKPPAEALIFDRIVYEGL